MALRASMFLSAETSVSFVLRLAHWWRSSKIRPAMEQCGGAEAKRIAHGLDASAPDLHTVAGKCVGRSIIGSLAGRSFT